MMDQAPQSDEKIFEVARLGEWCRSHGQPYFEPVVPAEPVVTQLTIPGMSAYKWRFEYGRPGMFCGRVGNAMVMPEHGFICTADLCLIYQGLTARDYAPFLDLGAFAKAALGPDRYLISTAGVGAAIPDESVFFGGDRNFGHFIFENLLRLQLLNRLPELNRLPIAVYDDLPARFLEYLDLLGFSRPRRISIPRGRINRFNLIWYLSSPLYRETLKARPLIWPEAIHALRGAVSAEAGVASARRPRLYIGRGDSRWRRLVNQTETLRLAEKFGLVSVDFSAMTAAAQIELMSRAELIVTCMGAAGAATIFAPSDCTVIELVPPDTAAHFGPIAFAAVLGQPFFRLVGAAATPDMAAAAGLAPNPNQKVVDADYLIDTVLLEAMLAAADANCASRRP